MFHRSAFRKRDKMAAKGFPLTQGERNLADDRMFLTNVLLKKVKSKVVMVLMQSTVTDHKFITFRDRVAEKKEMLYFDPRIEMECVFKEIKKMRGVNRSIDIKPDKNQHRYGIIPGQT